MVEREGFEPSVQMLARTNGLAIVCLDALHCNPNDLQSRSATKTHLMLPHSSLSGHHSGQRIGCERLV